MEIKEYVTGHVTIMSKLKKKKCPSSIISASKVLDKVFFANRH